MSTNRSLARLLKNTRSVTTHSARPHPLDIQNLTKSPVPLVYHAGYSVEPWPRQHSFRMPKFRLIYEHLVANDYNLSNLIHPQLPSDNDISIVHSADYIHDITTGEPSVYKAVNLLYSDPLVERAKISLNGTLMACQSALKHGIGLQISGGYHHAHREHGSGFCIFNDLAFAALHLSANSESNGIRNICILDLDVHQGDGTASILENVDNVLTCSVHCESNFPFVKQKSDIDVGLDTDLDDITYLREIRSLLDHLIAEKHKNGYPIDLVIYDGGVDVHQADKLGRLNVSTDGLCERDRMVFDACLVNDIPIACVIGGGYDQSDIVLAERHAMMHWNGLIAWNKFALS